MTTALPAAAGQDETASERRVAAVRLLVLFSLLPLLRWDVISPESEIALTGLSVLIAAYTLAAWFILPRLGRTPRKDLFLTIDILAITAVVFFTGGIRSSLLPLLYLPVLGAAIRFDLRQTFLSALAVSASVVWMWNVAEGGLPSLGPVAVKVGLFMMGSFLVAIFFGILAQETRLSRARASLNRILDEQLAEATEQLRRQLAALESSYDLARRLAGATDTPGTLEAIAETAQERLRAPFSAVFLHVGVGGGLSVAHARGIATPDASPMMYACAERLAEDTTTPMVVQVDEDVQWTRGICAPITAAGSLIGAACAGGDEAWSVPDDAASALAHIADQGGVALERAYLLEDLQRLALLDPVARLYSREQLDRILQDEVKRAGRLGAPFALLKVQIVGLADVSARFVEPAADLLHRQAAVIVLDAARRVDVVAQGERGEFFVLLSMTHLDAAKKFAAQVRQRLRDDATAARLRAASTGADSWIGIALFPDDAISGPELYYCVQNALEAAQAQDRIVSAGELTSSMRGPSLRGGPNQDEHDGETG